MKQTLATVAIIALAILTQATQALAYDVVDGDPAWIDTSGSSDANLLGSATLGADNSVNNLTVAPTANGKSLEKNGAFDTITINSDLLTLLPNNVQYSFKPNVVFNGGGVATITQITGAMNFPGQITASNSLNVTGGGGGFNFQSDNPGIQGTLTTSGTIRFMGGVEFADNLTVNHTSGNLYMWDGGNVSIGELILTNGNIQAWYGGGSDYIDAGAFTLKKGTVSTELTGTGNLVKSTADTVTLSGPYNTGFGTYKASGTHSYSGATTVEAGTLTLAHPTSTNIIAASPTITVNSGATLDVSGITAGFALASGQTLKGTGTIAGPVTVSSNAALMPGNSPGILTTDDLTLAGGSTSIFEIQGSVPGVSHDQVLGGALDTLTFETGSVIQLSLRNINTPITGILDLFSGFGDYTVNGVPTIEIIAGRADSAIFNAADGTITLVNAVPEPASLMLIALSGLALFRRRRTIEG